MATIPPQMQTFLHTLYGKNSWIVESGDKFPVYSVSGTGIAITTDAYKGCRVAVFNTVKHDKPLVKEALKQLVRALFQTRTFNYIAVDIPLPVKANIAKILPGYFTVGNSGSSNLIKDEPGKMLTYWKWTADSECLIPELGATRMYGAGLLLIDRLAQKVYLVRSKERSNIWECPGGGEDPQGDIELSDVAHREAQEEGGFSEEQMTAVPKRSATVVAQMELPHRKFGRGLHQIWASFADGMSGQASLHQSSEIVDSGWFDCQTVLMAEKINGFLFSPDVKPSLEAALKGRGLHRTFEDERRIIYTAMMD